MTRFFIGCACVTWFASIIWTSGLIYPDPIKLPSRAMPALTGSGPVSGNLVFASARDRQIKPPDEGQVDPCGDCQEDLKLCREKLAAALKRIQFLEKYNEKLKQELENCKTKLDDCCKKEN